MKKTNFLFLVVSTIFLSLSSCSLVIKPDNNISNNTIEQTEVESPNNNQTGDSGEIESNVGEVCNDEINNEQISQSDDSVLDEKIEVDQTILEPNHLSNEPSVLFEEGVVLVKKKDFKESMLGELQYEKTEELFPNSEWRKVLLSDKDYTVEAVRYLSDLDCFDDVDYDYIMGSDGEIESIDVSGNPLSDEQGYLDAQGIFDCWGYNNTNGGSIGGSPDVVVAVIDTGVDYNHIDLRDNIWTNSAEIPNNGIDDDGNGYIDDYYGWNCVGDNKDPMDDNGHGTHVAGIIAAENNLVGTVGVAFNCKVMCLKAGNSSGHFTNSDIVEAIQYAYMNGASVINMSFGGSSISNAVEDALENAYNQCVLVAAAGNDGLCNNTSHSLSHKVGISYPAAMPYVIGVMSTNASGTIVSPFSNYDDTPFNKTEYEVYACGDQVMSTWPNNKTAKLSGTSMACPIVAGIAALLRSNYTDREVYSNKYIQSQIVNTGTVNPFNTVLGTKDMHHSFVNVYEALTKVPKPNVSLYDYYFFDNIEFSNKNNGNGVVDAGETIHLAIELQNRGGVASNVVATIDTIRNGDSLLTDPYLTITNDTINLPDIGTYSVRNCGKIYIDNLVTDTELYFEIVVSDDCPNDYLSDINVHYSYKNGLDENDHQAYVDNGMDKAQLAVSSGYMLPTIISEDTVFTADKLYILTEPLIIPEGVTVTFEEGCKIQAYASRASYYVNGIYNSPEFIVYGCLYFNGTSEHNIVIDESELYWNYGFGLKSDGSGCISCDYVEFHNMACHRPWGSSGSISMTNSSWLLDIDENSSVLNDFSMYRRGNKETGYSYRGGYMSSLIRCYVDAYAYANSLYAYNIDSCYLKLDTYNNCSIYSDSFTNNVVYTGHFCENPYQGMSIFSGEVSNNAFISAESANIEAVPMFDFNDAYNIHDNYFSDGFRMYAPYTFNNYYNSQGQPVVDLFGDCSDYSKLYPFIKNVELINKDSETVNTVGKEEFTLRITFTRPMDTSCNPNVFFGSVSPYADYKINGDYVSDSVWEGTYTIKSFIENGTQHFRITDAYAYDEDHSMSLILVDNINLFDFEIDTTSALSMTISANPTVEGVELEWAQDDYDTLMGYNVYRSTQKDGNFVKINSSIIPSNENTFVDDSCEPGQNYWYTFTVVLSDFSESAPAGKVNVTALDTVNPVIYHTPVNQGYVNNNLIIFCNASDNIAISSVTLYYRANGETNWKVLPMSKVNDRYSATIFGSEVTLEGVEYYISATDGINTVTRGNEGSPYNVVIKDSSALNNIGDVDGDGVVTTRDALMIMQAINGDLLLSDDQFHRADLNNDQVLSSVEALRILQYINGNVSTLEML